MQQLYKSFILMIRGEGQESRGSVQKLSIYEKMELSRNLLKIIQYGETYSFVNTLFGYTLAYANIPLNQKIAFDLKQKFNAMQELLIDNIISNESISLIVIDATEAKKRYEGDERDKFDHFLNTLTYDFEEIITNPRYIYEKWENQHAVEEENVRNEIALKQFLEEEKKQFKMEAEDKESQGWECPVCCSQIDRNSFGLLECGHIFHPECINGYLKSKIESNEVQIACPMQGCSKQLEIGDIFNYIDGELKQKFQNFSFNKFVERNNQSTAWCPTAGCTAVFSFDEMLDNYKCPACKKHYCLKCKCEYHNGMTCAEYKINNSFDKNDQDFIKFVQGAKYKQCPKCKYWVERNDGCSTMTCKCGQEFCYECGGTTCPHGSCSKPARVLPPPIQRILPQFLGGKRKR